MLKKAGSYILIIILLPYIITVFLNGPIMVSSANMEGNNVIVQISDGQSANLKERTGNVEDNQITMSIEDYGVGVLAREIPDSYEMEAIKAQAILVRTKIYKNLQDHGSDAVMTDAFWIQSEMEEAWGIAKFASNYNKLIKAWRNTEGQVLIHKGKLAHTPFFSLSNGSTRDGKEVLGKEYPYLKIKDCPLDIEATEQIQTITLDKEDSEMLDVEILSYDTAGYVLKIRVGEEVINGEEFRNNYHLASSCFTLQEYEGQIRITTRGVGHGIGLSQYTANKMAENGNDAEKILTYFFENCELREVADLVRNTRLEE